MKPLRFFTNQELSRCHCPIHPSDLPKVRSDFIVPENLTRFLED